MDFIRKYSPTPPPRDLRSWLNLFISGRVVGISEVLSMNQSEIISDVECLFVCVCRLSGCMVTEKGCRYLASALSSNPSHLRELDLSYNHPGQSFIKLLSDPNHRLKKLKYVQH